GRVRHQASSVPYYRLYQLQDPSVEDKLTRAGNPTATSKTNDTVPERLTGLDRIRERGYDVDDGEQEIGVRCFAVPVLGAPTPTALSISGPDARLTPEFGERAVPVLQESAGQSADLLHAGCPDVRTVTLATGTAAQSGRCSLPSLT